MVTGKTQEPSAPAFFFWKTQALRKKANQGPRVQFMFFHFEGFKELLKNPTKKVGRQKKIIGFSLGLETHFLGVCFRLGFVRRV